MVQPSRQIQTAPVGTPWCDC